MPVSSPLSVPSVTPCSPCPCHPCKQLIVSRLQTLDDRFCCPEGGSHKQFRINRMRKWSTSNPCRISGMRKYRGKGAIFLVKSRLRSNSYRHCPKTDSGRRAMSVVQKQDPAVLAVSSATPSECALTQLAQYLFHNLCGICTYATGVGAGGRYFPFKNEIRSPGGASQLSTLNPQLPTAPLTSPPSHASSNTTAAAAAAPPLSARSQNRSESPGR